MSTAKDNALDPYEVLGIVPTVSQDELAKVYRQQAKTCHPDLFPGDKAAREKFRKLNDAYALINTRLKRSQYDRNREQPKQKSEAAAADSSASTTSEHRMHRAQQRKTTPPPKAAAAKEAAPKVDIRKQKPQQQKKTAYEAPPIVNFNFDLRKNSKSMSKGILTIPLLLVVLLLVGVLVDTFGGPAGTEKKNLQIIQEIKSFGEIRQATVKDMEEVEDQGHTVFYAFTPRGLSRRDDFFILTKKQAKALALEKRAHDERITKELEEAKAAKTEAGIALSKSEEDQITGQPFPFDVFTVGQVDFNLPAFLLDGDLLDDETATTLDSLATCLAEKTRPTELDCPHTKPRLPKDGEVVDKPGK